MESTRSHFLNFSPIEFRFQTSILVESFLMYRLRTMYRFFLPFVLFFAAAALGNIAAGSPVDDAQKLAEKGLHKDAYDLLRPWILDPKNGDHEQFGEGLRTAVDALQRLNRETEIDELLESAAKAQKNSWRGILEIAQQYGTLPSYGIIIDNKFQRGHRRGGNGGQWTDVHELDWIRTLQLLNEAMPLVLKEAADGGQETADGRQQTEENSFYCLPSIISTIPRIKCKS